MAQKAELFGREELVLKKAKKLIQEEASAAQADENYRQLIDEYESLLSQTKFLSKVGDRLHKKINKANELVLEKNRKLEETLELLLTEKAGRQAVVITFGFFLVIFILTEVLVDPPVEAWAHRTFPDQSFVEIAAGLGIKIFIALLLRPMEYFIEKLLIKKARMKRIDGLLK